MAFAATLHREARSAERHAVDLDGTLRDPEWQPVDVVVRDLSTDGFRALTPAALAIGTPVSIGLQGLGCRRATVVRSEPGDSGFRFDRRLSAAELATAITAAVTAPIAFPASGRDELWHAIAEPEVQRLPRWQRATVLAGTVALSWGAILGLRVLIG